MHSPMSQWLSSRPYYKRARAEWRSSLSLTCNNCILWAPGTLLGGANSLVIRGTTLLLAGQSPVIATNDSQNVHYIGYTNRATKKCPLNCSVPNTEGGIWSEKANGLCHSMPIAAVVQGTRVFLIWNVSDLQLGIILEVKKVCHLYWGDTLCPFHHMGS